MLNETGPDAAAASRTVLMVVFATILIDFIGFSVLIPVLPLFAERLGASPFQVGLILTVYALAQLLFLPAWGWVSDRIGRRPVILVSLFGTVCSFVLLAFADSIGVIYAARALAGFFAASIGTAQAVTLPMIVNGSSNRFRAIWHTTEASSCLATFTGWTRSTKVTRVVSAGLRFWIPSRPVWTDDKGSRMPTRCPGA